MVSTISQPSSIHCAPLVQLDKPDFIWGWSIVYWYLSTTINSEMPETCTFVSMAVIGQLFVVCYSHLNNWGMKKAKKYCTQVSTWDIGTNEVEDQKLDLQPLPSLHSRTWIFQDYVFLVYTKYPKYHYLLSCPLKIGPRRDKTCHQGFRQSEIQTSLQGLARKLKFRL